MIIAGVVLTVLGFSGSVDITFKSGDTTTHIVTGSLGIVILIAGVVVLVETKPIVKIKRRGKGSQ